MGHLAATGAAIAGLALLLASAGAARAACVGDCGDDGVVSIADLVRGVSVALGEAPVATCNRLDVDGDGTVAIGELIGAVRASLDGCGSDDPTATAMIAGTATPTATREATPTATLEATPPTATASLTPPATPTPTPSPTATAIAPTNLAARIDAGTVLLQWFNPDPGAGHPESLVLRKLNAPVAGPDDADATEIFRGAASAATDEVSALLPDVAGQPRVYHYAVFACAAGGAPCVSSGSATTLAPTLLEALRAGGYNLHWRHAEANLCVDQTGLGPADTTAVPDWWKTCERDCGTSTARQLDDPLGISQSQTVGAALDALDIPIGRVLSSEFCRNVQTAEHMDFGPPIEQLPALTYFVYDELDRCADSYALFAVAPAPGTNAALIGHAGFTNPCDVLDTLRRGEAAIFKPDGAGGSLHIANVHFDEWADLGLPVLPSELQAAIDGSVIRLTYNAPDPAAGYPFVVIMRRLNAPVAGPNDPAAEWVAAGSGGFAFDQVTNLLPDTADTPRRYHYAAYACTAEFHCESTGDATTLQVSLVQALRAGGYVLHWRHASATVCADQTGLGTAATTAVPDWWKSCDNVCPAEGPVTATARQLNAAGVAEATALGEVFDARAIPIGRVQSSEFCRNVQTAELMDFGPPIELLPDLTYFVYDEAKRCEQVYDHIAVAPPARSNTALIGHAGFTVCPILNSLQWSEAAIFKPDGAGGSEYIARVPWDQWNALP
ncbi:MAG: hypothetical protein ACRERC_10905 [Candidatus Binatia bacterium]